MELFEHGDGQEITPGVPASSRPEYGSDDVGGFKLIEFALSG
jgi:hypothetical protein